MRHWIFKTSPDKYRLDDRWLNPLRLVTWKVNDKYRDEVAIGDVAFVFRTGLRRAIVGALRVTSEPCLMEEIETERPYCIAFEQVVELRVLGELSHRCSVAIGADELRAIQGLGALSIFDPKIFQMATTFPVKPDEARLLHELVLSRCPDAPRAAP
jgi:hypothetical protein